MTRQYTSPRRIRAYIIEALRDLYLYEDLPDGKLSTALLEQEVYNLCCGGGCDRFCEDAVDAWYFGLSPAQRERIVQQAMR